MYTKTKFEFNTQNYLHVVQHTLIINYSKFSDQVMPGQ